MDKTAITKQVAVYSAGKLGCRYTKAVGLFFSVIVNDDKTFDEMQLKHDVREPVRYKFPFGVCMPCGEGISWLSLDDVPLADVSCPCGNPTHWLVKYELRMKPSNG